MAHGHVELAQALKDCGMWRRLPPEEADSEQRRVADGGYPFGLPGEPDESWFFIDGEEMAEGRAPQQLSSLEASLRRYGIELRIETVSGPTRGETGGYVISVNGRRCTMWSPGDWTDYHAWETATVRPLAIINDLLAEVRATERLFTLYAGSNQGLALLLDPRVVAAVAATGLFEEIPRWPTRE